MVHFCCKKVINLVHIYTASLKTVMMSLSRSVQFLYIVSVQPDQYIVEY